MSISCQSGAVSEIYTCILYIIIFVGAYYLALLLSIKRESLVCPYAVSCVLFTYVVYIVLLNGLNYHCLQY